MPDRIPTDELLADLREVADELGLSPTMAEYDDHGTYSAETIRTRFPDESWSDVLSKAGVGPHERAAGDGVLIRCPNCGHRHRYGGDQAQTNCPNCHTTIPIWRGRIEALAENELLRAVAAGPKTPAELPRNPEPETRQFLAQLSVPGSGSAPRKARGSAQPIWYLYGDEREAIRRFIQVNHDYVASCLGDQSNPLQRNWNDDLYHLLVEQWLWTDASGAADLSDQEG